MSSDVLTNAQAILANNEVINRHSLYQLKYFVLGKESTIQGRLRKCLNELSSRIETLEHLNLAIADAKDDILLAALKIEKMKDKSADTDLHREWLNIQIRKAERRNKYLVSNLQGLEKKLKECEIEVAFFTEAFKQLEKIEPLRAFDDLEKESKFWNEHFAEELQLRLLLKKPLDTELVRCILAMDKNAPIRSNVINMLDQIQQQANKKHEQWSEMDRAIEVARGDTKQEDQWPKESQR